MRSKISKSEQPPLHRELTVSTAEDISSTGTDGG